MHTVEHILNQTMVRHFHCTRAVSAHIERKKSKCDYTLPIPPTQEDMQLIESKVNEIIQEHLPVTVNYITQQAASSSFDLSRLPENATKMVRVVSIGNYDACLCIGSHVENTAEIGQFQIISHQYSDGKLRIRFKILPQ